jgi:hypothetical protein
MPPSPHLLRLVPRAPNRLSPLASRTFHQSARPLSNKDAESADDKDTLTPERAEYTRSGTDAGVAQNKVSSFDPKLIRPDEEREMCGKGNVGFPRTVVSFLVLLPLPPLLPSCPVFKAYGLMEIGTEMKMGNR